MMQMAMFELQKLPFDGVETNLFSSFFIHHSSLSSGMIKATKSSET